MRRALLALALAGLASWPQARAESARAVVIEHEAPGDAPAEGPADALVTLELFLAPGDGARSARAYRLIQELIRNHAESIRVRYRLVGRSGQSDTHAEVAHEAHAQGRLAAFLRESYRNGRSPRRHELEEVAERAGMDLQRMEEALADRRHAAAAERDHHMRRRARITRVPGLLVGGAPFESAVRSLDELSAAYAAAEARALELVARGVPRAELDERMRVEVELAQPEPHVGEGLVDGKPAGERRADEGPPRYVGAEIDLRGPHSRGPADAPVPVVFYCSFSSRYCAQMFQHTEALRRAFPDEVRLVFKHVVGERGDGDVASWARLHEAALCADAQGGFWDMYEWLYTRSRSQEPDDDALARAAHALGLDAEAFSRCLEGGGATEALERARVENEKAGVEHAPAVVIGGRLYTGTKTFAELRALVARELAPGLLERLTTIPPLL